jgi:hypothetical protein
VSRLWTRFLSAEPGVRAGIVLGRERVCAVNLDAREGALGMSAVRSQDLMLPLFDGPPTAEAETVLAEALRAVSEEFRGGYAAVHVALPDTVIRSAVFELDELPKASGLREALLRWRFSKEWLRPEESLECRGIDLGNYGAKRLFFGQAADRAWLDCVRRALTEAGVAPWSLNAASSYRFNRLHDVIAGSAGALLSLDPDCWNLLLWDADVRVRRVVTRLRKRAAESEMSSIAHEVQRTILAYVGVGGAVGRLYFSGGTTEMAALEQVFDGDLEEKAVMLHMDEGIAGTAAGTEEGMAALAIAAAMTS